MAGNRTGYLFGVFDVLTVQHLDLVRQAAARCDALVVGVADDILVRAGGSGAPLVPEQERRAIVAALRGVACAVPLADDDVIAAAQDAGAQMVFACADGELLGDVPALERRGIRLGLQVVRLVPARRSRAGFAGIRPVSGEAVA